MTNAPWTCPQCGEEIEPQFTSCWNCGSEGQLHAEQTEQGESDSEQSWEAHSGENESVESALLSEHETPESLMDRLLRNQLQQGEQLDSISSQVGCLYACMLLFVFLIVLQFIFAVLSS